MSTTAVQIDPKTKRIAQSWRKSRIAARLLLRQMNGRIITRDAALGKILAADPSVTPRLIQQALDSFHAKRHPLEHARRTTADEETGGDMFSNTKQLWQTIFGVPIDVRREIIAPALARRRKEYEQGDPKSKDRLANL